jgi:hypothetical protein
MNYNKTKNIINSNPNTITGNTNNTAISSNTLKNRNNNKNILNKLHSSPDHIALNTMCKNLFPDITSKWKILEDRIVWILPRKIPKSYIKNFDIMFQLKDNRSIFTPTHVLDIEDKRLLFFSYKKEMTTLKDAIVSKRIKSHKYYMIIMKRIIESYKMLNEKYDFRMFDITPEHILVDEKLNIFWFGFLYTQTNEYPLSNINKLSQVFKSSFYFTNKMNIRYERSILNIFKFNKNKNNLSKLNSNIIDLIRIFRFFNTSQVILFLDKHKVEISIADIRVLNSDSLDFDKKLEYILDHFDIIFSS